MSATAIIQILRIVFARTESLRITAAREKSFAAVVFSLAAVILFLAPRI